MEQRHENKFIFTKGDQINFKSLIINGYFRKLHENRIVNSIYYDNVDLDSLYQNINGSNYRVKHRVRWYNQVSNSEVFFEKKIKSGLITKKQKISLGFFKNYFELSKYLHSNFFIKDIVNFTSENLIEVLTVSYQRAYFSDYKKKLRATYDTDIKTQKKNIKNKKNSFFNLDSEILELKYGLKDFEYVKNKIKQTEFNQRNQKFSKYVKSFLLLSEMGFH
tara:strand:+ start:49 stop:708 length:660 start_codon:yes stop_codon:yes gene_type:complete